MKSNEKYKNQSNSDESYPRLEQIRKSGICKRYDHLKRTGLSPRECLEETATFARVSPRETKNILEAKIQRTGKKRSAFAKYFEKIDSIADELKRKKAFNLKVFDITLKELLKDRKLNKAEKQELKRHIDNQIEESKNWPIVPEGIKEENCPSALQDMIKTYTEESETKPVDDIIEYFELNQNKDNKAKT